MNNSSAFKQTMTGAGAGTAIGLLFVVLANKLEWFAAPFDGEEGALIVSAIGTVLSPLLAPLGRLLDRVGRSAGGGAGVLVACLATAALLAGCSAIQGSEQLAAAAAQQRMEFNDNKARALVLAACDMSVGAFHRALDQAQRDAVVTLCGGSRTVTAQDIVTLRALVDAVRALPVAPPGPAP